MMTEIASPSPFENINEETAKFQFNHVFTIISAHFINDTYSAFLAPLLPNLIEKLSLTYTQAGSLSAIMQIPSILNPIIGYLDDKVNLRNLVIFAPAITATTMTCLGIAPDFVSLLVLLFVTGVSIAFFHAPSPAMIARASGYQVGKGMSLYMAAGELGRTIGPLVASWGLLSFSLNGMIPLAIPGWIVSSLIYLRYKGETVHIEKQSGFRGVTPDVLRLFLPMIVIMFFRSFLVTGMGLYLPTFLEGEGSGIWKASLALAIYQFAGVFGAVLGGTISDRIGRRPVLFVVSLLAPCMVFFFLQSSSWLTFVVLILAGLFSLSAQPIMLAIVQDQLPNHRSVGNGVFMGINFICLSLAAIIIGLIGDRMGLRQAFMWTGFMGMLASPIIWILPKQPSLTKNHPLRIEDGNNQND